MWFCSTKGCEPHKTPTKDLMKNHGLFDTHRGGGKLNCLAYWPLGGSPVSCPREESRPFTKTASGPFHGLAKYPNRKAERNMKNRSTDLDLVPSLVVFKPLPPNGTLLR